MTIKDTVRAAGFTGAELARQIGVTRACVSFWFRTKIPAERVLKVEQITGVSRHVLRPDIFPVPE